VAIAFFQMLAAIDCGDTGADAVAGRRMGSFEQPTMTPISINSTYIFMTDPSRPQLTRHTSSGRRR
jgi:hypothetical protein